MADARSRTMLVLMSDVRTTDRLRALASQAAFNHTARIEDA